MKRELLFIFCLAGSLWLSAQVDSIPQNNYQQQLEEQFKKESVFYRLTHGYELTPGFSRYALGASYTQPLLSSNKDQLDLAVRYRQTHFEASAAFFRRKIEDENGASTKKYQRVAFGYFSPINALKIGTRTLDVKGMLIQPSWGFGYTNTDGYHGAYTALGMHLQLPFVVLEVRANVEYAGKQGFEVFPEISLQLDALRNLLDPSKVRTGTFHSTSSSSTSLGGGWYSLKTTYSSTPFEVKDVGPFWGVTPRFGTSPRAFTKSPFTTYGIGVSGRINYLGIDIRIDKGTLLTGVVHNANDLDQTVKSDFDNGKVKGLLRTNEVTIEGSANVVGLFLTLFKKQAIKDMSFRTTPLNRLNFHLGFTHFKPTKVSYVDAEEAEAYTNQFFTDHPEIERNAINDPLVHKAEWGVSTGLSYEMGAIGVRVMNRFSKSSGKSSAIEVYYIIPLGRLLPVYKAS